MTTVTPYEVKGAIDYDKVIKSFGVSKLDQALLERLRKHTKSKKLHYFFEREIFFAHRDLVWLLDQLEKGNKFFLYTGRGPSGNIHLGHLIPLIMTKWFQDEFDAELYFQFTDDEKYLFKKELSREDTWNATMENAQDIMAIFNPKKTHLIIDTYHANIMYPYAIDVAKKINFSTVKSVFGFTNDQNIGTIFYTAMQAVPAFLPSALAKKNMPCLIPHAVDQDPHFRATRDVLPKLGYYKPASIQSTFLPGLAGMQSDGKMSSSEANTTIMLSDDEKTVKNKINKYAFSGGQATIEEHRTKGGNPDVDIAFQYLRYFEEDGKKLEQIRKDYTSGKMLTGELKTICIAKINEVLAKHRASRDKAKPLVKQCLLKASPEFSF